MQSLQNNRTVAIVGRPNVGKSAIFNRLAGKRISIVHDQPGVTRDRITASCELFPPSFNLIDTGGIGSNPDDSFNSIIQQEVDIAMEAADLILFVVDAVDGLTPVDQEISSYLRKSETPIFLVANKVDEHRKIGLIDEFSSLGFDRTFATSAAHNIGINELAQNVSSILPDKTISTETNNKKLKMIGYKK